MGGVLKSYIFLYLKWLWRIQLAVDSRIIPWTIWEWTLKSGYLQYNTIYNTIQYNTIQYNICLTYFPDLRNFIYVVNAQRSRHQRSRQLQLSAPFSPLLWGKRPGGRAGAAKNLRARHARQTRPVPMSVKNENKVKVKEDTMLTGLKLLEMPFYNLAEKKKVNKTNK